MYKNAWSGNVLQGGYFEKFSRGLKLKLTKRGEYNKLRIMPSVKLLWVLTQLKMWVSLPENYLLADRQN
jgi:hypothetical protein